jgi:hemerythrin-like domain-containing protein
MLEKRSRRSTPDAISLLKDDHKNVKDLLSKLESGRGNAASREQLVAKIENELRIHTQIEEDLFYPAFRDAARTKNDKKLYFEAIEEHNVVDMVLPDVRQADAQEQEIFSAKVKVLKDIVEHHIEEEEGQMFPKARKTLGQTRLRELGVQMQNLKQQLSGGSRRRAA